MAQIFNYFLGVSSPTGFSGFFESLCEPDSPFRLYIIKSGPGCGKSSMMKRIADRIIAAGYSLELVHCSSDPDSLDGVLCRQLRFAIIDGTHPHVIEPRIPAAVQNVVSLYDCIDDCEVKKSAAALQELLAENKRCLDRARRFIAAAGSLCCDNERTARSCLIKDKVVRYAKNLSVRILKKRRGDVRGTEFNRFSLAPTPRGLVDYTAENFACSRALYVLDDRFGAAAHLITDTVKEFALSWGYDTVCCRNPLSPYENIDSLFIPELSVCLISRTMLSRFEMKGVRCVNTARFYDREAMAIRRKRLGFSRKAALELVDEACSLMAEAKSVHDRIEAVYRPNVDFDEVRRRETKLCESLGI